MSIPKLLLTLGVILFGIIGVVAYLKENDTTLRLSHLQTPQSAPLEVELENEIAVATPLALPLPEMARNILPEKEKVEIPLQAPAATPIARVLPEANRIEELFNKGEPKLPIVETIVYKSRVSWQKGRPAWLSDYATHYATSRHFIARSLNGKPDYLKQDIAEGDRFNVMRLDRDISFHLLIDVSRCKLWFYYLDNGTRVLLKTYDVGLGRLDGSKASGWLTPLGTYLLGSKIATYKPKVIGFHNGQKTEMIRIFGSRWIPFDKEVSDCTAPAKGLGLHGVPWVFNPKNSQLEQDVSSIGKHESDGCIRLSTQDVEELFSIIITKKTTVELVNDFFDAKLPGVEK